MCNELAIILTIVYGFVCNIYTEKFDKKHIKPEKGTLNKIVYKIVRFIPYILIYTFLKTHY